MQRLRPPGCCIRSAYWSRCVCALPVIMGKHTELILTLIAGRVTIINVEVERVMMAWGLTALHCCSDQSKTFRCAAAARILKGKSKKSRTEQTEALLASTQESFRIFCFFFFLYVNGRNIFLTHPRIQSACSGAPPNTGRITEQPCRVTQQSLYIEHSTEQREMTLPCIVIIQGSTPGTYGACCERISPPSPGFKS